MIKKLILDLHPTQISVGYQQVHEKSKKLSKLESLHEYLETHPVPIIIGPKSALYIIDHHHLCCALDNIGKDKVFIKVVEDWSSYEHNRFWKEMQEHKYVWMYDENGKELCLDTYLKVVPKTIKDLKNDPYRSIAGVIRKMGIYKKDWTPFSEFTWANFLRKHMDLKHDKTIKKFSEDELDKAISLSKSDTALGLPGLV